MTLTLKDFAEMEGRPTAPRSAAYDESRAFLFEGLEPRYATRTIRCVMIPMRDGVRLATRLHVPVGARLPLPVVLARTPYGNARTPNPMAAILPEQGFVHAVQDVRGRHQSEGEFVACGADDRNDGVDTLDWLTRQDWCSGSIGTIGTSYLGETAAKLAAMRHPSHKCGVIMFDASYAGGNSQNGGYLQGGVTMLRMMFEWFRSAVPRYSMQPPPGMDREAFFTADWSDAYATQPVVLPPIDLDRHLMTLPVHDMLDRSGAPPSAFGDMMRRADDPADPYWDAQGFLTDRDQFHTPTIHITGPLERGGSGFDNFRLFQDNAVDCVTRDNQFLWFTPAPHSQHASCSEDTRYGARHFGDTRFPYHRMLIDWFGHWLRGDPLDLARWPRVQYFAANRNAWHSASDWPPPQAASRSLYLQSQGAANTRSGDGRLSFDRPVADQASTSLTSDPGDPVPSEPFGAELDGIGGGYADRGTTEDRHDVLVYTSDALASPLDLAGPVSVDLFVSSSAKDTDFIAVLSEVDLLGRSINISQGVMRMRYREGRQRAEAIVPGRVYRVTIDLWHVAITVPAGHRLRLSISSSYFPYWDRNLNTGGDNHTETGWVTAKNRVHHGATSPSRIILPVLDQPA